MDHNAVLLIEEWESQEDLDRRLRFDEYRKILAAIDMAREHPDVRFLEVANKAGLEVVERASG